MFPATKINREGLPFVGGAFFSFFVAWRLGRKRLALAASATGLFLAYFFRDPYRRPPEDPSFILAPADGRVIEITRAYEENFLKDYVFKVSIFMTVFDVHVNRAPVAGRVLSYIHRPGCFLAANKPKASQVNERAYLLLERDDGQRILTVQVAGLLARRIVRWVREGQSLEAGERFGMIRFGSRLDVYFPTRAQILVREKERVRAGKTPIAYLPIRD